MNIDYLDNKVWEKFSKNFENFWNEYPNKEEILKLVNGDKNLAMVII